jgi:hypothetical protein
MSRPRPLPLLLLLPLLSLPTCQLPPSHSDWTRTDLYFGLTRRDSSPISDADFQHFTDTQITALFPDGFTLTPAAGQYLDTHHTLHKEPTRILTILYKSTDRTEVDQKLRRLIDAYCRDFDQESILREDFPIQAEFAASAKGKGNP